MRYLIIDSPDAGERQRYFSSKASPEIGKRLKVGGRHYEVVDIELCRGRTDDDPLEVQASVRRID